MTEKFTFEGAEYSVDEVGSDVLEQLQNIRFVEQLILQRNNELQVAQTAKIGYTLALKRELDKIDG